ncbi:MAG: hypothetical protein ACXWGZ_04890 [Candidatus Aminicenantales bacterium]
MIKRIAAGLLIAFALTAALRADWRTELNARLGRNPDYRAALDYLVEQSKTLEPEDKQTAAFILPFLAARLDDKEGERTLVADYFETYFDNDPDFGFLDEYTLRNFIAFWISWKRVYPLVHDVNLLSYSRTPATGLPASVDVGLEILNEAFYRVSLGPYILEGGHWPKGFHILTIPLRDLFARSDTYEFILDLKAGDLIVRKPVRVQVEIADIAPSRGPAPEERFAPPPATSAKPIQEGEILVYIDGKLVLRSRKIAARPAPFTFPLGGPLMRGQKPYMPPPTNDPMMMNGVNIVDALALAYKAIKDLVAKKPPKPSAPSYQKVSVLSFAYSRTTSAGQSVSARASLSLPPARAVILKE